MGRGPLRQPFKRAAGAATVPGNRPGCAAASLTLGLLVGLAAIPAVSAGPVEAQSDLDALLSYVADWVAAGHGEDEAPHLVELAVAAGRDPATWPPTHPALDLLQAHIEERQGNSLIYQLRPAYALALAGRLDAEGNLTQRILAGYQGGQFGTPGVFNDDMWSLIALGAAGVPQSDERVQGAAEALLAAQDVRGAWSWVEGGTGETDMTAMALHALAAVGRMNATVAKRGLDFIGDETYPDGGVPLARPGAGNCDSTSWSIRAHALAEKPVPPKAWEFLRALRHDDGSFRSTPGRPDTNILCTLAAGATLGWALQKDWGMDGYGPAASKAPAGSAILCIAALALPAIGRKALSAP